MSISRSLQTGSLDGHAVRISTMRISTVHISTMRNSIFKDVYLARAFPPMTMHTRRCHHCVCAFPRLVEDIPRIVEDFPSLVDIPRRVPLSAKDAPETVLRQADVLQQGSVPDQVGWPVLIFGAVALAVAAEVAGKLKNQAKGVVPGSQSKRPEVQAARKQDNAFPTGGARDQSPEAAYRRQVMYVDRFEERNRGLLWLAAITAAILGIAGWFNPNSAQPFLF